MNAPDDANGVPDGMASLPDSAEQAQTLSDRDQNATDRDQTESDLDQTSEDADQGASERDQLASDRDQEAADDDQRASDRSGDTREGYARTRRARSRSALERDRTSQARSETAHIREQAAKRRDKLADWRDEAASDRDRLAAALDEEIERMERDTGEDGRPKVGIDVLLRAAGARKDAAASRERAAKQREAAAEDRTSAARDRRQAALDRAAATEEIALEGIDHLTGALRRRVGLAAIQREMDRTSRTGESLLVAFVDVDGLKPVNDAHGHAAGDELLRATVATISEHLRSYDVITRFGGDEFVCTLAGQDIARARKRFDEISIRHAEGAGHGSFTVGLAERQEDDTLASLIDRADMAMTEARRRPTRRDPGALPSSNGR